MGVTPNSIRLRILKVIPAGFSIRLGTGVRNGGLVIQAAPTGRAFVCENGELLVPDGNEGGRWIPGGREVEEGLLWYDTDGTLAERVQRAMARYRQKYGADPATCYVNPADWGGETQVEGIEIKTRLNVLPGHVWAIRQVPPGVIEVREHLNSER